MRETVSVTPSQGEEVSAAYSTAGGGRDVKRLLPCDASLVGMGLQMEFISSKLCFCSSGNHELEKEACLSRDTGGMAQSHGRLCALTLNCSFPCIFLPVNADEEIQPSAI